MIGNLATTANPSIIAVDATESVAGRALLTISSLYFAAGLITRARFRFVGPANADVRIAIEVFAHDTGADCEHREDPTDSLRDACLFGAIAFRSAAHLPLEMLRLTQVPFQIALQYPDPEWESLLPTTDHDSAFDPRRFALRLERGFESVNVARREP